jgi:hypothetical protein
LGDWEKRRQGEKEKKDKEKFGNSYPTSQPPKPIAISLTQNSKLRTQT